MPLTTPSPLTLTLRLKHHKTTILLHVDPLTTIASLKSELLHVLQETTPSKLLSGHPLPTSEKEIVLGRPRDVNDTTLGWTRLKDGDNDAIKSLGVKEGGVLVFKWGPDAASTAANAANGKPKKKRFVDEALGDEDLAEADLEMGSEEEDEEEWDVVIPSYEDVWGMEALMSQGVEGSGGEGTDGGGPVTPRR